MNTATTLSYRGAMTYLGVNSYNTFKKNYLEKGLPVIVLGKSKRILKSDIDKFIAEHRQKGGELNGRQS